MSLRADTWARVGTLFDELAELSQPDRERRLRTEDLEPELRQWLDKLLAAHDSPEYGLLDQTLDGIVQRLATDQSNPDNPNHLSFIPADLEGRLFGSWRATEEIARGGMAVVLRGERADDHFEKAVAIKLLLPGPYTESTRERFQEEIRILARLEHPHIARLIDGGLTEDGLPYLIMEYIDGQPLTEYCDQRQLNLDQRLRLWLDVAGAASHAHHHLVVHCDIKPSNILVGAEQQVKLVDFGIAGLLTRTQGETATKNFRCSPAYAAPEQFQGAVAATAHDVFGLGAVLYELLTGARIRQGRQLTRAVLQRRVDDNVPIPSGAASSRDAASKRRHSAAASRRQPFQHQAMARYLRGDGDAIILRALASDPDQRYPSIDAMIADIRRWRRHEPVHAREASRLYWLSKWFSRNRWLASGAMIAALSLTIGASVAIWQAQQARAEAALSGATRNLLLEMFAAVDPWRNQQQPVTADELVNQAVNNLPQRLNAHPRQKAEILYALGEIMRRMGRADDALPLHQQALTLWQDLGNAEASHRALAAAGNDALDLVDMETAKPLIARVINEAPWPPRSVAAVDARLLDIQILTREGAHEKQQTILDQLLASQEQILQLAEGRERLGRIYIVAAESAENQARYEDAIAYAHQAAGIMTEIYGAGHPLVGQAVSYIATTRFTQGRYDESLAAMDQALDIDRTYYGDNHPQTLWSLYTKGRILFDSGRLDQAVVLYNDLVRTINATYGPEDPRLAITYANLGKAWRLLGDARQAADYYARGLPITEAAEADHPKLGTYYTLYGQILSEMGQAEKAQEYFVKGIAILEKKLGDQHPMTATGHLIWADHLNRQGDHAHALEVAAPALDIVAANIEADNHLLAIAQRINADALMATGQTGQADQLYRNAASILNAKENYRRAYRNELNMINQALVSTTAHTVKRETLRNQ